MNQETFAANLRQLRLAKGYTQEQLAERLQVSPQSVSRWECGNTLPDVMLLPRIARIYAVTVDDLYREPVSAYANYAQRLVSVYEATGRTEDFLLAEQECTRLLAGEHTADDLRSFGVLYHYMLTYCATRAAEYLDAAMEQAERSHWVYSSAAQQKIRLMCDLGRGMEEAARHREALERHPEDPMTWILCVAAHHDAGLDEQAYALVTQAIDRFPDHPALQVHAGNICQALGRYAEAFTHWNRTLELDKTYLDAVYSMGFCYEALGQFDKALAVWDGLHRELLRRGFTHECQLPEEHMAACRKKLK